MLHFIYGCDLVNLERLRSSMHRDRAIQFHDRLEWDVTVTCDGLEVDQYDGLDPLYVIWEKPDGTHGGSARFLPTTGRTMVNEHFHHLTNGVAFRSPFIWECTRFCLSPGAASSVAAAVMLGGAMLMRTFSIDHFVGVFDARMLRVYRRIGSAPDVLATDMIGRSEISVGLWQYGDTAYHALLLRSGITESEAENWFAISFNAQEPIRLTEVA